MKKRKTIHIGCPLAEQSQRGVYTIATSMSGMRVSGVGGGVWSKRGSGVGGGGGGGTARVSQGGERVQSHTLILVHLLCRLQHTHTHTHTQTGKWKSFDRENLKNIN